MELLQYVYWITCSVAVGDKLAVAAQHIHSVCVCVILKATVQFYSADSLVVAVYGQVYEIRLSNSSFDKLLPVS